MAGGAGPVRRARGARRRLSALAATLAVSVVAALSLGATAAYAAPDPTLYPNVVDVPGVVTTTYAGPGTGTGAPAQRTNFLRVTLPMGATTAGTAKVLHGAVVNTSPEDQCLFFLDTTTDYSMQATDAGAAAVRFLETSLPVAPGVLPSAGSTVPGTTGRGVTSSTSDWNCEYGQLIPAGGTLSYTVTAGVPLGGTDAPSPSASLRLELAQRFDQVWVPSDYCDGAACSIDDPTFDEPGGGPYSAANPRVFTASTGTVGLSFTGISGVAPSEAYSFYAEITNDLGHPVTVTSLGYTDSGRLAPFITGTVLIQSGAAWVTAPSTFALAPGESTPVLRMMIGSPWWIGNESQGLIASLGWSWQITAAATHTVSFDPNAPTSQISGTMPDQTDDAPTALTANAFVRAGYTFTGWNTQADGTGTAFADGAEFDFAADLTLYAQWAPVSVPSTPCAAGPPSTPCAAAPPSAPCAAVPPTVPPGAGEPPIPSAPTESPCSSLAASGTNTTRGLTVAVLLLIAGSALTAAGTLGRRRHS